MIEEPILLSEECFLGSGETVLAVDDDPMQLRIAQTMLTKLGYKVSTAKSGEEAIAFMAENPQDVVLLDMVMGGMNGSETLRAIQQQHPHQVALIVSGFAPNDLAKEAFALGARKFLSKPIKLAALSIALHEALHSELSETASP